MTPKIKPLEWHPTTIAGEHLRDTARDMDGRMRYEVGVTTGHFYLMINLPNGGLESRGNFPSVEAAKQAAQEHNDARIMSAFEA